jgi:folate-binding protein YgfZ
MAEVLPLHAAEARLGAVFAEEAGWEVPEHFGDEAAEYRQAHSAAVVFDVSHRGKVEMGGADALRFLHNLSSNDILHLTSGKGCEAFVLTLKAKVVAYLTAFHLERPDGKTSLWLDLAPSTATKVITHLEHYLISERVEFTDHTQELVQLHVAGPAAQTAIAKVFAEVPSLEHLQTTSATFNNALCQLRRQDRLGIEGYDILCPTQVAEALWTALIAAGVRPAGRQTWEVLRIEAGTPAQGIDIDETTFAPEVDRTAQAICYTKGCYLGQEPVVMARDRGQVNRFLRRLTLPDGPVPAGSRLFRDGKEVGRVTSSARSPAKQDAVGLGYVRRGSQDLETALEVEVSEQRHACCVAG